MRTYAIKPKCFGSFVSRTNEFIHLRTRASPLLGYWTAEMGGINQVVHIWEYSSLSHRAQVRKSLGGDVEWKQQYLDVVLPMWQEQTNSLLSPLSPVIKSSEPGGAYLLKTYMNKKPQVSNAEGVTNIGVWQTLVGTTPSYVQLLRYSNIDDITKDCINNSNQDNIQSKILIPTVFSPLK
uniref:NIPSNAP domain-containing protein n=1 Tax=Arcella intermedia TaxID=1963864 RepID=A0A6B2LKU3_9EUKA